MPNILEGNAILPILNSTHNQKRKLQSRMSFASKNGNILKNFRDKSIYFCSVVLTVSIDCYLSWTSVSKSWNSQAKLMASDLDGFYVTSQHSPENLDFIFLLQNATVHLGCMGGSSGSERWVLTIRENNAWSYTSASIPFSTVWTKKYVWLVLVICFR
jgi:hypothetical protein